MTPETLGRYEILGELGKGAMGVVYLAQDPLIQRQLAIKTFRMAYSAKEKEVEQFKQRFLREARAVGQLNHPNVVTIHDLGQEDDEYFIAMEYVKGVNLKQKMQREDGPLPLEFVIDVTAQIADGLAGAHSKGIVHRDVKPANIIITQDQQAKITDFGIARIDQSNLTVAGQLLGTPNYMAPEQIQGHSVDTRTDIFSLGVLLYEMLTRKKPFAGENLTQVSHRIVYDDFTPPEEYVEGLPPELGRILLRALEKEPDQRYQLASEMAEDLKFLLEPEEPLTGQIPVVIPELEVSAATPAASPPVPVAVSSPPLPASPPPPAPEPPRSAPVSPLPAPEPLPSAPVSPPSVPESSSSQFPEVSQSVLDGSSPSEISFSDDTVTPSPPPPSPPPPSPPPPSPSSPSSGALLAAPASEPSFLTEPLLEEIPAVQAPTPAPLQAPALAPLQARPPSSSISSPGKKSPARVLGIVALLIVAVGALGMGIKVLLGGGEEIPEGPKRPSVVELQAKEDSAVREANRLVEEGDPGLALSVLLRNMQELPAQSKLGPLYLQISEQVPSEQANAVEAYVQEHVDAVEELIPLAEYEQAYDVLERILLVDPENAWAAEKSEDIRRFINRPPPPPRRSPRQANNKPPPPSPPRAVTPPPPVAPSPVDVAIHFLTHLAEGQVTVQANGEVVLQDSFNFDNRKTFKRKFLKGERGFDRSESLPSGTVRFEVFVEVELKDGRQALEKKELTGNLVKGMPRTLSIVVQEDLAVSARLQ